jgi:hypothetical protein
MSNNVAIPSSPAGEGVAPPQPPIINGLYASDSSTFSRRSRLRKTTVPTHPPVRLKDVIRQVQADYINLKHGRLLSVMAHRHSGTPSPLERRPPHQAWPRRCHPRRAADYFGGESVRGLGPVLTQLRRTSATLHAWAMQPRGINGASASKISLMEPIPASIR